MHLTRLQLDPRHAEVRRDLGNPYEMHRTLTRAFVSDADDAPLRFLWRLEPSMDWNAPVVLVQSEHPGQWNELHQLGNYLKSEVDTKAVSLDQLIQLGATYRFRLSANPTVTRDGKRFGLASEDVQLAWLHRQGLRWGFEVNTALVTASDVLTGRKGATQISLQRVCFEGVLAAQDCGALAKALLSGIGPGKAFGLGLLSVARVG